MKQTLNTLVDAFLPGEKDDALVSFIKDHADLSDQDLYALLRTQAEENDTLYGGIESVTTKRTPQGTPVRIIVFEPGHFSPNPLRFPAVVFWRANVVFLCSGFSAETEQMFIDHELHHITQVNRSKVLRLLGPLMEPIDEVEATTRDVVSGPVSYCKAMLEVARRIPTVALPNYFRHVRRSLGKIFDRENKKE